MRLTAGNINAPIDVYLPEKTKFCVNNAQFSMLKFVRYGEYLSQKCCCYNSQTSPAEMPCHFVKV